MDVFVGEGAFACLRVDATIRKRCRHQCEVAAGDQYGALAEIEVEDLVGVALHHRRLFHQGGDGAIAVARLAFGAEDFFVDVHVAADEARE